MSRTQNVSEDKLKKAIEMIRSLNADAHIITTPWDSLDGKQILAAMENVTNLELEMLAEQAEKTHEEHEHEHHHHDGECCCGHHHDDDEEHEHHHHDHDASAAVVTIMMKMRSMNIIITTMVMSAAIITMTTSMNIIIMTMKDITMQMMYLQAGEKRRLTNMIKKHLMLFLKNLPIQMNMAVF